MNGAAVLGTRKRQILLEKCNPINYVHKRSTSQVVIHSKDYRPARDRMNWGVLRVETVRIYFKIL